MFNVVKPAAGQHTKWELFFEIKLSLIKKWSSRNLKAAFTYAPQSKFLVILSVYWSPKARFVLGFVIFQLVELQAFGCDFSLIVGIGLHIMVSLISHIFLEIYFLKMRPIPQMTRTFLKFISRWKFNSSFQKQSLK